MYMYDINIGTYVHKHFDYLCERYTKTRECKFDVGAFFKSIFHLSNSCKKGIYISYFHNLVTSLNDFYLH